MPDRSLVLDTYLAMINLEADFLPPLHLPPEN